MPSNNPRKITRRKFFVYSTFSALGFVLAYFNSNTKNKLFAAIDVWRVYRNYERLNLIDSFYNFMHYAFNALKKRI